MECSQKKLKENITCKFEEIWWTRSVRRKEVRSERSNQVVSKLLEGTRALSGTVSTQTMDGTHKHTDIAQGG